MTDLAGGLEREASTSSGHAAVARSAIGFGVLPTVVLVALQAAFVEVIYGPTLRVWFLNDAWVHLDQARRGLWHAVSTSVAYHYIPVASAFKVLVLRIGGLSAPTFQVVALALHVVVGYQVYRLGRRLFGDVLVAIVASLLFLGSAAFHEVTFWPVIGSAYVLAAFFYLLGFGVALDLVEAERPSPGCWWLALWFLLAVFSFPGAVTLPALAAATLVGGRFRAVGDRPARPWTDAAEWRWIGAALLPCAGALVLPALARLHFASVMSTATVFRFDWLRAYWFLRSLHATVRLRASSEILDGPLTLWGRLNIGNGLPLAVWAAVGSGAVLIAWSFVRARRLAVPVLSFWVYLQLGFTVAALLGASRHTYLPSIPGLLLVAYALRSIGERIARPVERPIARASLAAGFLFLAAIALLHGSSRDLRVAAGVWTQASDVSRATAAALSSGLRDRRGPLNVFFVNLPKGFVVQGIGAYPFASSVPEMVRVLFEDAVASGTARHLRGQASPFDQGPAATMGELAALASDPGNRVFLYDSRSGRVELVAGTTPAPATP